MIINTENLEKALKENDIMLVQFWAPWCGPCRALTPVIDKLEEKFGDVIGRCNTDDNQDLVQKFAIRGIPTLIMFKNGEEVERFRSNTESFYSDKLKYYLSAVNA